MSKKRNNSLRTQRDLNARKKPHDGTDWAKKLLSELKKQQKAPERKKKRKVKRDNAKRLRADFL